MSGARRTTSSTDAATARASRSIDCKRPGSSVGWLTSPLDVQGYSYDRGALVVSEGSKEQVRPLVETIAVGLGLRATGIRGAMPTTMSRLARPRIGLYKPWVENIDEGWTR